MATKTDHKWCQKGNQTEEERDWANLPEGIVAQIGEISLAHDLLPYISLRGVCHRWRQATKNPVECLEIAQKDLAWHLQGIVSLVEFDGELLFLSRRHIWGVASLVESDGELLFLSRWRDLGDKNYSFFQVFRVVIEEGVNGEVKPHLVPLNNISKRAILINKEYGSFSVSPDVFPCIKPNSIYFCQGHSLNIYHPGGICSKSLDPNIAPPGYCYWPDGNSQFIRENIYFFCGLPISKG